MLEQEDVKDLVLDLENRIDEMQRGQLAYFLIYNPFTVEAHALFRILPASIAAFFLPALIYWVGMRFWLQERYQPGLGSQEALPATLQQPNI